jgi:hypothetical protein
MILAIISSLGALAQDKSVLAKISGTIIELKQASQCNLSQWKGKITDACQCCLIYYHESNNITECTKNKQCNESSLAALKSQYGEKFLETLIQNNLIIKPIKIDNSLLAADGSVIKLAQLLSQAFKENKIINKAFSSENCMQVKNLGKGGGYNTLQLFLVSSTCSGKEENYIIKEPRDGVHEAQQLSLVAESPKLKDLAVPKITPGLPSLALPVGFLSYSKDKKTHDLVIMPAALGADLASLILKFKKNQSKENRDLLSSAFLKLGEELGQWHKQNMKTTGTNRLGKTVVHGDFHPFNLFYDANKNHFTFIDNESIATSLKEPGDVSTDIIKLFFMPFSINTDYAQFRDLIDGIDLKTWFDISLKNFITGYRKSYAKNEQSKVLQELKNIFIKPFSIKWVDFYEEQLDNLRKQHFVPVFDELARQE